MDHKIFRFDDITTKDISTNSKLADCMGVQETPDLPEDVDVAIISKLKDITVSNIMSCSYCNVKFSETVEHRGHFKLDWHRYNLRLSLAGKEPVTQDKFISLADDVSSISGSESDSEESDSEVGASCKTSAGNKLLYSRHAKVFFQSSEDQIWSVYRCLLHDKKKTLTADELLVSAQSLLQNDRQWMVVMLGGGHFAACIFLNNKEVIHKTFHCYTVRAKQGGSQSSADSRGGGGAKSAGASLRRYNEQQLVQHVQSLMLSWKDEIAKCSLLLFRAAGPYNRAVLFGGKNAPLDKTDARLRSIPFPTRRPTMKEVKRVHEMLSCVESYGPAEEFKNKYPKSPDKRDTSVKPKVNITSQNGLESFLKDEVKHHHDELLLKETNQSLKEKQEVKKKKKKRHKKQADPEVDVEDGEGLLDDVVELATEDVEIDLTGLEEYKDTVQSDRRKRKKKLTAKQKTREAQEKLAVEMTTVQQQLLCCVKKEDTAGLEAVLKDTSALSAEDLLLCINSAVAEETQDTLLHMAATLGKTRFVTMLLEAGADPTVRNKKNVPPYNVSADKQTKDAFKKFVADHPGTLDLKQANIPEPLTEEQLKEQEDRKREKKKDKRIKEKIKKKEYFEKTEEEKDKMRFMSLSDREKCALAAERRLIAAQTKNLGSTKAQVLHRCFECAQDITGKVPFEYGINKFCSVICLKKHRAKTHSYGVEI